MSNRDGTPGRKPRVTDDEILTVIAESDKPALATSAIAGELPIKHRGTLKRLNALLEAGRVERMEVGPRGQVWYLPDETSETTPTTPKEVHDRAVDDDNSDND